jgi:hypothetical protein
MDSYRDGDDVMPKFYFGGRAHQYYPYIDFDIMTDDKNEHWRLTYIENENRWYGVMRVAPNDEAEFDDGREATREEVAAMLETMPIEALPVEVFI